MVATFLAVLLLGFSPVPSSYRSRLAPLSTQPRSLHRLLADDADPQPAAADAQLTAIGLTGLAGSVTLASTATTMATAAGGACAGGACVAGAGMIAGGGTGGATVATALAGGGLLAGAKAMLVSGALLATGMVNAVTGAPTLESMVQHSTPLEMAIASGKPTVIEFYGNSCSQCRDAASKLRAVEAAATGDKRTNWVMLNTDDPSLAPIWQMYHVDELPHFEFFDAAGSEVGFERGVVDSAMTRRIEERIAQLGRAAAPGDTATPMAL